MLETGISNLELPVALNVMKYKYEEIFSLLEAHRNTFHLQNTSYMKKTSSKA